MNHSVRIEDSPPISPVSESENDNLLEADIATLYRNWYREEHP
jgi:hypothetical protein